MIISTEVITPEIAQQMLTHNVNNRNVNRRMVEKLKRDILSGNFQLSHQGIAFGVNGDLLDGQHRLIAIQESGIPVSLVVARDVSQQAVQAIDTGKSRDFIDYAVMSGLSEHNPLYVSKPVISAVRKLHYFEIGGRKVLTNAELKKLIDGLMPWLYDLHSVVLTRKKKPISSANAAFLAALINGVDPAKLSAYAQVHIYNDISGCDGYNVNAALIWSKRMLTESAKGTPLSKENVYYGTQNAIWLFINAVNTKSARIPTFGRYPCKDKIASILGE